MQFQEVKYNFKYQFWNTLSKSFQNIKFSIQHIGFLEEEKNNPRASIRWFFEGKHSQKSQHRSSPPQQAASEQRI